MAALTSGLISCKDALARSYNPLGNGSKLLLLLRREGWVLVSHPVEDMERSIERGPAQSPASMTLTEQHCGLRQSLRPLSYIRNPLSVHFVNICLVSSVELQSIG